jgi:hypothetical protein
MKENPAILYLLHVRCLVDFSFLSIKCIFQEIVRPWWRSQDWSNMPPTESKRRREPNQEHRTTEVLLTGPLFYRIISCTSLKDRKDIVHMFRIISELKE